MTELLRPTCNWACAVRIGRGRHPKAHTFKAIDCLCPKTYVTHMSKNDAMWEMDYGIGEMDGEIEVHEHNLLYDGHERYFEDGDKLSKREEIHKDCPFPLEALTNKKLKKKLPRFTPRHKYSNTIYADYETIENSETGEQAPWLHCMAGDMTATQTKNSEESYLDFNTRIFTDVLNKYGTKQAFEKIIDDRTALNVHNCWHNPAKGKKAYIIWIMIATEPRSQRIH